MGRVLALDYGEKRIGWALSDPLRLVAQPGGLLPAEPLDALSKALQELVQAHSIEQLVVGLPREFSGNEGSSAQAARRFAAWAAEATGLPVDLVDERFTSVIAERTLQAGAVKGPKRKQKIDALAAALVLETWLARRRSLSREEQVDGPDGED